MWCIIDTVLNHAVPWCDETIRWGASLIQRGAARRLRDGTKKDGAAMSMSAYIATSPSIWHHTTPNPGVSCSLYMMPNIMALVKESIFAHNFSKHP